MTDPLRHGGILSCARWSPRKDFVATGSFDRTVRVWPVDFLSVGAAPTWLPDLAEAVGGKRLVGDHLHTTVKPAELLQLRETLLRRAEPEQYRVWLQKFFGTTPATPTH